MKRARKGHGTYREYPKIQFSTSGETDSMGSRICWVCVKAISEGEPRGTLRLEGPPPDKKKVEILLHNECARKLGINVPIIRGE